MTEDITSLQIRVEYQDVERAERALRGLAGGTPPAIRQSERLETQSRATNTALQSTSMSARKYLTSLAAIGVSTATVGLAVRTATREWLAYDKAMREVNSITTQSNGQFKDMRREVLELSTALGVDATLAARGLYQALSAGVARDKSIGFLDVAARSSVAGVTSVDVAVDGLTNTLNAFKMPAEDAEMVADKLFATVVNGKTTFEELASNMSKVAVPASTLGATLDDVLALFIGLTKQGVGTAEASTQIAQAMTAITNPSEQMLVVFEKLNVSSGEMAVKQYGLVRVLEEVRKAYAGNSAGLFQALRSVEAFRGVLGTTAENLAEVEKGQDNVASSSGMMAGAYKENAKTLENALISLKGASVLLVEQMEGSLGIIGLFTEALKGASLAVASFNRLGLKGDTDEALSAGVGVLGSQKIEARIRELQSMKEGALKAQEALADVESFQSSTVGKALGFVTGGPTTLLGMNSTASQLEKINKELAILENAQRKITPEVQRQVTLNKELESLATDRASGNITEEEWQKRKNKLLTDEQQERMKIAFNQSEEKIVAEENKKIQEQMVAKLAEEEELRKKQTSQAKTLLAEAEKLGQSEAERLELKKNTIQWMMSEGTISEEQGRKAIENFNQQIALLKEREAAKGGGGGGGGSSRETEELRMGIEERMTLLEDEQRQRIDLLKAQPSQMLEAFRMEEQLIKDSYERRKEIILAATETTEDQKQKLLEQAAMRANDQEAQRLQQYWDLVSEHLGGALGDLASVAQAFGKKGFAAYKALAMAEAAVALPSAIIKAYVGGLSVSGNPAVAATFGSIAGAAIGAQIATIAKQEYVGAYATGGLIPPGRVGLVGEAGPELVQGPAMVTSAQATWDRRGASSAPSNNVEVRIINNTGETVQESRRMEGDKQLVEFIIGKAKEAVANSIRKGGDAVSRALEGTYNMSRGRA